MSRGRILIVDDEQAIIVGLREILEDEGYETVSATDPYAAIEIAEKEEIDAVILDIVFVGFENIDGLDVLRIIKEKKPELQVIMLTGHGTIEKAVKAVKMGAFDFLEKPISSEKILITLKNALAISTLEKERKTLLEVALERYRMVGVSPAMKQIFETIDRVAESDSAVLICGESGTGKELIARAIHLRSSRAGGPFVAVNCAAIPDELVESELFGHLKGSFTGAYSDKQGKFELADGGTLFLDEISDLSPRAQAKVLRAIETKEITPVGARFSKRVNVRIISATNKDIKKLVEEGKFREDLFFRISVIPIYVPPLRERREDIPVLINYYLKKYCEERKIPLKKIHPGAMNVLLTYSWEGNVRQLKNVIEAAVVLSQGEYITYNTLRNLLSINYPTDLKKDLPLKEFLREVERQKILEALEKNDWDYDKTAKSLGLPRSTFFLKLREHGISKRKTKV